MRTLRRRTHQEGFTLVELLAATVASLFVLLAAFALSRSAMRIFSSEGRIGSAQSNLRQGLDLLRADLQRAGFMTTANVALDPDVGTADPNLRGFPARLQSVFFQAGDAATAAKFNADNGLHPDQIVLSGNFASADLYAVASIEPNGSGQNITLQADNSATRRLMQGAGANPTQQAEAVAAVFGTNRILRLRNELGNSQFLVINGVTFTGGRPVLSVAGVPPYIQVDGASAVKRVGGTGLCIGCEVNPVHFVRYSVASLAARAGFAWAYNTATGEDQNKYELIREELDQQHTPMVGTSPEIVAEYAVDLAFSFSVDTSAALSTTPTIAHYDYGAEENKTVAGLVGAASMARPQRIRTVRYRMSVRARDPDRTSQFDDYKGPGLMRYQLGTGQWARVRTVTGEVSLFNTRGIRW